MSVFRYCIHRVNDGAEVVVPIGDVHDFLQKRITLAWRATPAHKRLRDPEGSMRRAVDTALDEAWEAARVASLRL